MKLLTIWKAVRYTERSHDLIDFYTEPLGRSVNSLLGKQKRWWDGGPITRSEGVSQGKGGRGKDCRKIVSDEYRSYEPPESLF